MSKKLFLVDATAFCYRAFYALQSLTTSSGQPTNAIYGFLRMLQKILREHNPDYLAACFDVSRDTFRTKKFADYKIQRPPMPDNLKSQLPLIKELVSAYGIKILEKEGFEADDVIATMVKHAKAINLSTTIVSSDKDILQLVDEDTVVFSPYKDQGTTYDTQEVMERYGIKPKSIADIIALMGDSADNIPGVPGIGEKTAVRLIKEFGSMDNLLKHLKDLSKEKIKQAITDNLDTLKLNQELVALNSDVGLDFDWQDLLVGEPDAHRLRELFTRLEFHSLLKELPAQEPALRHINVKALEDSQLHKFIREDRELFLYGRGLGSLVLAQDLEILRVTDGCRNLSAILENPRIKKVSHDLKKLKNSLANEGIKLEGLFFDTMIAAYLLNAANPQYALGDLEGKPTEEVLALVLELKPKLDKELQDNSLAKLFYDIEMPLVEVLAEMELTGIKLDTRVLTELSFDIEKRLIALIADIYELSGIEFNINSPKQLRDILFVRLKLPVVKKTKTGPSTDEEVLKKLAGKHKLPAYLLEYRGLMKLKTTYIDTLPELLDQKTGRIHACFNQTGTETGRISCSTPNLQNIPIKTDIGKQIRRAFVASSNNLLLACDYSQIELRILAHLSKDECLICAFKENKDIHKATAALICGVDEKDVADDMRDLAKRVNFGIVYGLTSYGLSRDLNISPGEAQCFIDAYFSRYPKVKDYQDAQIKFAQKNGYVSTILGRRRPTLEINNKNQTIRQFAERQAVNAPIQGSAADLIKLAMVDIHKQIKASPWKSRMVLQIHDELIFDAPEEEIKQLVPLVKDRMENVLKLLVPIKVEIKSGRNWLETEDIK